MDMPNIERELHTSVAEHQILLSFTNDDDALIFHEWWYMIGEDLFASCLKKNKDTEQYNINMKLVRALKEAIGL